MNVQTWLYVNKIWNSWLEVEDEENLKVDNHECPAVVQDLIHIISKKYQWSDFEIWLVGLPSNANDTQKYESYERKISMVSEYFSAEIEIYFCPRFPSDLTSLCYSVWWNVYNGDVIGENDGCGGVVGDAADGGVIADVAGDGCHGCAMVVMFVKLNCRRRQLSVMATSQIPCNLHSLLSKILITQYVIRTSSTLYLE